MGESVRLEFEGAFLLVEVDGNYDTMIWSVGAVENLPSLRPSTPHEWLSLISFRVRWLWLLTNHRGFQDGLELRELEAFGSRREVAG